MKKVYFIKKDFIGFPLDIVSAYYDEDGELIFNRSFIQHIPKTLAALRKTKIVHFNSLEEILNFRICTCNKKVCDVNEELYKIVNNKLNQRKEI